MNKRVSTAMMISTMTVSLAFISGVASAQQVSADTTAQQAGNDTLDVIVVTALRRNQLLQDVPAAISVLDAETLEVTGAKDYRDYINSIPGVSYNDNGYRASRITIRGIADSLVATSPLTGIYIDEAPVTEGGQPTFDPSLYDVERVEVLKGPQGTLYGSGSMGGTVRVILNKPDLDEFAGEIDGTAGTVAHGDIDYRLNGLVNVPIVTDKVGLRVVGSYRRDGGYIDDSFRGDEDANSVKKTNVRGALRVRPGSATTIDLSAMYQKERLATPNYENKSEGPYEQAYVYPQTGPSETKLFSGVINHDFEWANLISATNYLQKDSAANIDATGAFAGLLGLITGVPIPGDEGFGISTSADFDLFTQEVRLSSTHGGPLEWLAGAFYSHSRIDTTQGADVSQAPSVSSLLTGPDVFLSMGESKERQIAAFGELTYNITDRLALTAGLRAFDIKQSSDSTATGILNGGTSTTEGQADSSSLTQKYLVNFEATRNNLIYAQAVQGFRAGGVNNPLPQDLCGADLAAFGYSTTPTEYEPDKLWNYELGSKNTLLDGRATLNGAVYYISWDKIQNSIFLPTCLFSFTANAGKATSNGVELDGTLRPWPGLSLAAAISYTDTELTESAPGVAAQEGDRLPFSSKWSWSANAQYDFAVSPAMEAYLRADISRRGSRWTQFESVPGAFLMPAVTVVGARIGVATERWSAALFATNLFDERIVTYETTSYKVLAQPRVVGINVSAKF